VRTSNGLQQFFQQGTLRRVFLVSVVLPAIYLLSSCASTPPRGRQQIPGFPSPLQGPGGSVLDTKEMKGLENAITRFTQGDGPGARSILLSLPETPQSRLLLLQMRSAEGGDPAEILDALQREAELFPDYAAAWCTLARHAEKVDRKKSALEAAEKCSELFPGGMDAGLAATLQSRWVAAPLIKAAALFDQDNLDDALNQVEDVLELEPENGEALLLKARILQKEKNYSDAEAVLVMLPRDTEAVLLRVRIALEENRWQKAIDLLNSLPPNLPERAVLLRRAHMMWRLSILPEYVREASVSQHLTREEFSILVNALAPDLESLPGAPPPLVTDIIDRPGQRAILTVIRLKIIGIDSVTHHFFPMRKISNTEFRDAVDAVCHLLGLKAPLWCEDGDTGHCVGTGPTPDASLLIEIMLNLEKALE